MTRLRRLVAAALVLAAAPALVADEPEDKAYADYLKQQAKMLAEMAKQASHEQVAEVKVSGSNPANKLQTLCLDGEGRVLALVAPPRHFNATSKGATSEVQVFDSAGKKVGDWKVPFHAHSINAAPDGTVYVAGDGKVARFDKAGKPQGDPVELPHIADLFKDKDAMRKKAEERLKRDKEQMAKSIEQSKKQFEDRIKKLEEKKSDDLTKTEKRQLEQYKSILKSYEQSLGFYEKRTADDVLKEMASRLRIINGIAVSDADVFVACGEPEGWGYGVWRMTRELKDPKKVLGDIGGCCGQMDVQVQGADLLVAENTKHQFARYTRDGKKLGSYGKRGQDTDPACFGSCCNPMNVCCNSSSGDVFTAESEGVVKRFSPAGEFKGVVGTVKIAGGCKNVAIGVSADGGKVYFCDQPGSRFFVLAKKAGEKKADAKADAKDSK